MLAEDEGACGSSDADKLTALGISDCSQVLHDGMLILLTTQCEAFEAEQIADDCKQVSSGCRAKLSSRLETYKPEEVSKDSLRLEHQEGFEATMGILHACGIAAEKFVSEEAEAIKEVCTDAHFAEDFETMDISSNHCEEYITTELTDFHVYLCLASVFDSAPNDPDDVDKTFIDTAVEAHFDSLVEDSADRSVDQSTDDRLRLFQTMITGKKWAGRKPSLSKFAVIGGGTLTALMVAVAVGIWRRSKQYPAAENLLEMPESAE